MKPITRHAGMFLTAAALISLSAAAIAQSTPAYKDASAPTETRIADLLQRMTPEEKAAQLEGASSLPSFVPAPGVFAGAAINVERAKAILGDGIGTYAFVGDFAGEAGTPQESARKRNLLQKWVLSNTRLGIPILFHGEALHGAVFRGATTFPEVVGLGSTWDPALIQQVFSVVAQESRAIGNAMVLAPVLDLSRDPRYGRDEEMYSEGEEPGGGGVFGDVMAGLQFANADKQRIGGYSGATNNFTTVLTGIRHRAGTDIKVVYAEGCRITEPDINPQLNQIAPYQAPSAAHDTELIAAAVAVARTADTVLLVLGGNEVLARESFGDSGGALPASFGDSDSLDLPGSQMELVREIAALGKPIVAVLINGKAYSIGELIPRVPAIVEAWYPGQETGNAVAGILFGDVNPSGHLPVTIARNAGQLPVFYYKHPAARRGYVLDTNEPLFPFGFGLSYTSFAISKPTVDRTQITAQGSVTVSVTVSNTGPRDGDDVIQLYVHHEVSSVVQPVILLKAFQRVTVPAGKSVQVNFLVNASKLAILDRQMKHTVEPGAVQILVGDDSIKTVGVTLMVGP